jgi:glucose-6-phosphate isomerase
MEKNDIGNPALLFMDSLLTGDNVLKSARRLGELPGVFRDQQAYEALLPETLIYEVYSFIPGGENPAGGLNFGITHIQAGKVGDEYYMTKGHFHALEDRAEYYWGLEGEGVLILMDRKRKVWGEKMFPGSLHYIPGGVAHRVANTGNALLAFAACWPSDAGHNYEEISTHGFSASLIEVEGVPQFV